MSPSIAMHTVVPANSTARPEVLTASVIESGTLIPFDADFGDAW